MSLYYSLYYLSLTNNASDSLNLQRRRRDERSVGCPAVTGAVSRFMRS